MKVKADIAKWWGMDQPQSVLHGLPDGLRAQILSLPPELIALSEQELEIGAGGISRQDRRVRLNFWQEYEKATQEARSLNLKAVAQDTGLPSWAIYEEKLYQNAGLLAWLMRPPATYVLQVREAQELGLNRLHEILSLPIKTTVTKKNKSGEVKIEEKINVGVALLILNAFRLVDQRLMGGYTQKQVNVNVDAGQAPPGGSINMATLDEKLKELEAALGDSQDISDADIIK